MLYEVITPLLFFKVKSFTSSLNSSDANADESTNLILEGSCPQAESIKMATKYFINLMRLIFYLHLSHIV